MHHSVVPAVARTGPNKGFVGYEAAKPEPTGEARVAFTAQADEIILSAIEKI